MQRKSFEGMDCSIAKSLEEVGEWWSLLIVRECTMGSTRFDEFQTHLGIARNVLTARLTRLTELGIIERFPLPDRANTDGYRLTKKGEDLYPVIVALMQWGDRWCTAKPGLTVVENGTGQQIEKMTVHAKNGKALSFRDVRFTPGPGASKGMKDLIDVRNERILGFK
jgi:DNA-binding HxlR family transcriptional regulator